MDPNSLSNLDPKLKETYERVMGASTPSVSSNTAAPSTTDKTPTDAAATSPTDLHQATASIPPVNPIVQSPLTQEQPTVTSSTSSSTFIKPIGKSGHSGLIKVFYALGTVVFFMVYIIFWMKILNLKLPF